MRNRSYSRLSLTSKVRSLALFLSSPVSSSGLVQRLLSICLAFHSGVFSLRLRPATQDSSTTLHGLGLLRFDKVLPRVPAELSPE